MIVGDRAAPAVAVPRSLWVGVDERVPIANGQRVPYVNFDNAASTPPLRVVRDEVDRFLDWYASIHRGAGFKSRLATAAYEEARDIVGRFVGADPGRDGVVFTKHATESVNLLASLLQLGRDDVVALSVMEHHANMLPWRRVATPAWIEVDAQGRLDLEALESTLRAHAGAVRLVAISGASNVTGYVNPIHAVARLAHEYGARVLVDAAQLVAHRPIDMRPKDDPEHLDFLVFSGHKIYAPYGAGVLVAPRAVLDEGRPLLVGGGAVKLVTRDDVLWEDGPELEEAGSPNVVGAVALALALRAVRELGFDAIEETERSLTRALLTGLHALDGIRFLGSGDTADLEDRLGVVSFQVGDLHHSLVAAALANEWGVGVRDGCFCAHPYLIRLLQVPSTRIAATWSRLASGDRSDVPGAVRVSFAPYNRLDEVERLLAGLRDVSEGRMALEYRQDVRTGDYEALDWSPNWSNTFSLED